MREIFNKATLATNSFGIDLTGTFMTAGYGGDRVDLSPAHSEPGMGIKLDIPGINGP